MFKNNLISVLRSFWKSKTITFINITGLTVGLTVSIILIMVIRHENSYDTFHKNSGSIYRVISGLTNGDNKTDYISLSPAAFGENLKTEFPGLGDKITLTKNSPRLKIGETLYDGDVLYADNNFLKIFSFNLIKGSADNALAEPYSIVLTRALADKIFGNSDPFYRSIEIKGKNYKVTAIAENVPSNSSVRFNALISLSSYSGYNKGADNWSRLDYSVYVQLPESISKDNFESKLGSFIKKHTNEMSFCLQPLLKIHLHSKIDYAMNSVLLGNISDLYVYSFFVFFILLIAVINYTNISFNQILKKSNEVGMRRILGASKIQIFMKSWLEALLICTASFAISLILIKAAIPELNSLMNRNMEFSFIFGSMFYISLVLLSVSVILGLLPALKLIKSSNPQTLKKGNGFNTSNGFVKVMLVVQFAIALFFIITTMFVSSQVGLIDSNLNIRDDEDFIVVNNTGFNQEDKDAAGKSKIFFDAVSANGLIKASAYSGLESNDDFVVNGRKINCFVMRESEGYFSINNHKIISGRKFNEKQFPSDAAGAVVVNESFIKKHNLTDPLNAIISSGNDNYNIIGVVEDYYFSLKDKVTPQIVMLSPYAKSYTFKVDRQNSKAALGFIKNEWTKYYPDITAKYQFERESMQVFYHDEMVAQRVFKILSIISISLALLGVLGLSSLIMIKKKKEIAIRKIHGATSSNIILQLSKEFITVIAISFLIAGTVSYGYTVKFLEDYAYKTSINSIPFIMSLIMVTITVLAVIIIQSLKSLRANPVESIKSE